MHSWAFWVGYIDEVSHEEAELLRRYATVLRLADPGVRRAMLAQLELIEALYTRHEPRR